MGNKEEKDFIFGNSIKASGILARSFFNDIANFWIELRNVWGTESRVLY
jgi:hypothetical protein